MSTSYFDPRRREQRIQAMVKQSEENVRFLVAAGVGPSPAGTATEYQQLMGWRDSGDPRYWNNPQVQSRFNLLAQRFGMPGPIPQPFGAQGPASPQAVLRATGEVAKPGAPVDVGLPAITPVPGIPD